MKRRIVTCLISATLLLSGCWDQRELSTITVVIGMAVDKGEHARYKVSLEGVNAAELNEQTAGGNSPTVVFSLEGDTIAEVTHKMNIKASRNVIFSHMKTVVISREIAEEGILEFIDFLERDREIRDDFNFIVVKEGKAADLLKVVYTIQKASSLKLQTQLETASDIWGSDPDVRLSDFLTALVSPGRQPVLVAMRIQGDPKKGTSVNNMKTSEPDAAAVIDSMALFRNLTLEGFLSVDETRNYLFTQDKIKKTLISVPCEKERFVALQINYSKTKLKASMKNGRASIQINVSLESFVNSNQCENPLDDRKTYEKYEKLANQYLKENIEETIQKVQKEYGVDIFGFGDVLKRQDYKNFKKVQDHWDEYFKDAEIDVNPVVHISRSGLNSRGSLKDVK